MAQTSLNTYKKAVEMFDRNNTRGFIMSILELTPQQYAECLKLYTAVKGEREKKPKKTREQMNREYYNSHKRGKALDIRYSSRSAASQNTHLVNSNHN